MRTLSLADVGRLRREAKYLKNEKGITHRRALDELAAAQGWRNWTALLAAAQPGEHSEGMQCGPLDKSRYFVHGDEDDANPEQYYCEFCDRFEQPSHFQSAHRDDAGRRTMGSLEGWRKLSIDAKRQYRRPNNASNLFQDLYRQPPQVLRPKDVPVRQSEPSGMFHAWLCEQDWRSDNVGEFARLVACHPKFLVNSDAVEVLRQHFSSASTEELVAFEEAWDDFLKLLR